MNASVSSAAREVLAIEALRRSGFLRLQVSGASMLPSLWPGDVCQIASCLLNDVARGEIVLAARDGRLFLHRLADRMEGGRFLLRGDSLPGPDPIYSREAFLGRLVSVARDGQAIAIPAPLSFWQRVLGQVCCYCGPARRLALRLHRRPAAGEVPTELSHPVAEAGSMR